MPTTIKLKINFTSNGELDIGSLNEAMRKTKAWHKLTGGRNSNRGSRASDIDGVISGIKIRTSAAIKKDLIESLDTLTTAAIKKGFASN